jgi:hypothetical protein
MTGPDRADGADAAGDGYAADERDVGDAFDRRVGGLLDSEAGLLRQQAELLLTTGSTSIERPGGLLSARLRRPGRLRGGALDISARTADGSGSATGHVPLARGYRDEAGLLSEITLQLAVHLTWLDDPAA